MKKLGLSFLCLLMLIVAVWNTASAKTIDLSYNTIFPPTHPEFKGIEAWARDVEKRSGGQIKITVFPGGTLSPTDAIYDSVSSGVADMGTAILGYSRGRFPVMALLDYPLGFPNAKVANRVGNEFYRKVRPKELADVKVLSVNFNSPAIIQTSKKPVRALEDMKGLKIRAMGLSAETVKALGAVPVALPIGETFEALQRGLIDGVLGSMEGLKSFKADEVTHFSTESYCIANVLGGVAIVNLKKWNSFPKEIQAIFQQAADDWVDSRSKIWDEADKAGRAYGASHGHLFIPLAPGEQAKWKKAVQPVIDAYVADTKTKGLPGKEYVDLIEKLMDEQTKAVEAGR
jgi:TRAP-type transport system periplasmic protein